MTTEEQVFPISLQTSEFDTNLWKAPKTLKDLVKQCRQKGHILDKSNEDNNKLSFLDNIIVDTFLFIAAIISLLATIAIIHLVCKHTKLKALVTGIAFHSIKQTETLLDKENILQNCTAQWYTIAALTFMIIGLVIYIFTTTQRCTLFKRRLYSNTVAVLLFFSDIKQYMPVKLCQTVGSIHFFQIYGKLTSDQITLERKYLWDVIKIDWGEVFVTLNGARVQLPILVKVPFRDKYRLWHLITNRSFLLHVMLRQGTSWYALDNIEYLLPPPHLEESEL